MYKNMKKLFLLFIIKSCFLLQNSDVFCSRITDNQVCETYYENSNSINCVTQRGKNVSTDLKDFVILDTTCKNANSLEFIEPPMINSTARYVDFIDCPVRPGVFQYFNTPPVYSVSLGRNNRNPVLEDNTFLGICSVTSIYAEKSGIETVKPKAFRCVKSIKALSLSDNKLEYLPPDVFKEMVLLQSLDLSNNNLSKLEEGIFDDLVSLKVLYLHSNSIHYLPDLVFEKLKKLYVLNLNNNNIETVSQRLLSNTVDLWSLDLSHNKLKKLGSIFSRNVEVRDLNLAGNVGLVFANDSFNGLRNLNVLNLDNCNMTFLPDRIFIDTPVLQYLKFSGNRLESINSEMFNELGTIFHLDLSFNNIVELNGQPFKNNSKLKILNLKGNAISEIKSDTFQDSSPIGSLDLSFNRFEKLENSLSGLTNLNSLILSHNFITHLHKPYPYQSFLSSLTALQDLDISNNTIQSLPSVFFNNSKLTRLDISKNPQLHLSNDSFIGLSYLKILKMNYCNITNVPSNIFLSTPNLSNVFMHGNDLQEIDAGMFSALKNLKLLDVSNNEISYLIDQPFKENKDLKSIFIFQNHLQEIKSGDFTGLTSLKQLDISKNNIEKIENNSFQPLTQLEFLNISRNLVSSLSDIVLHCENLTDMDISFNKLNDIGDRNWHNLLYFEIIRASNNMIDTLNMSLIPTATIHLEQNHVERIYFNNVEEKTITESKRKTEIYLAGNPIECDCHSYNFYQFLKDEALPLRVNFVHDLICQSPAELQGKPMHSLQASDFICNITENCPELCTCGFRGYDDATIVNCNIGDYEYLPVQAPHNTNVLYIQRNDIITLKQLEEPLWDNLTELYVDGNDLVNDEFYIPPKLKLLGITDNELTALPDCIKKHAENVKDFKVALAHNCWSCDCSVVPLKDFISEHGNQIKDLSELRCKYSDNKNSPVTLSEMSYSVLCPYIQYVKIIIALSVVGVIIVLISIATSIFYYRHKRHILAFLYTHANFFYVLFGCDRPSKEEKLFDCFISYSSTDREVTHSIVEKLEDPIHCKFCIHERNWMSGKFITTNIIDSIQNSRKTLIILSDTFLKSEWFNLEFQAAYNQTLKDKKDRLILVLMGDLPDKNRMANDLKYVMSTKTYLEWGERWFWEKLRYSIYEENNCIDETKKSGFEKLFGCFLKNDTKTLQTAPVEVI